MSCQIWPFPANTRHSPIAVPILGQRRRQWANFEAALGECSCLLGFSARIDCIQMERKQLTKIYVMILNWRNPLISMVYIQIFQHSAASVKESFSFKTRMPGTVKCRPAVAYWVQIDGINIATELITRYYSNETLIQCCFNVRPTSATLAKHWTNIR